MMDIPRVDENPGCFFQLIMLVYIHLKKLLDLSLFSFLIANEQLLLLKNQLQLELIFSISNFYIWMFIYL